MDRIVVDLDRDLPKAHLLESLPRLLLDTGYQPVLQLGCRFPWSWESRLRGSWVYPEHALVAYAEAVRREGRGVEIALGRYGMIRGTEEIATVFGRFCSLLEGEDVVESEIASYALFLGELVTDLRELLGPVERVYLFLPRGLGLEQERGIVEALRGRLSYEGVDLLGVHGRDEPIREGFAPATPLLPGAAEERYRGSVDGEEVGLLAGELPLWAREAACSFAPGVREGWAQMEESVSRLWRLRRRGEELETALLIAASAGDPSPLAEGVLLTRLVVEEVATLRGRVASLRTLLSPLSESPELLLLPARAAERAAGALEAMLMPLRSSVAALRFPPAKDEAGVDGQ
ncbi:MAG: hypothetical protein ACOC45_04135 [Alkalispirochaetaceae bacterium]